MLSSKLIKKRKSMLYEHTFLPDTFFFYFNASRGSLYSLEGLERNTLVSSLCTVVYTTYPFLNIFHRGSSSVLLFVFLYDMQFSYSYSSKSSSSCATIVYPYSSIDSSSERPFTSSSISLLILS